MSFASIAEAVPPPILLDQRPRMIGFADELRRHGYDLAGCAKRLGVFPRLGVNFWRDLHARWNPQPADPLDTLLEIFMDGHPVTLERLTAHFSSAFVDAAIEMRLAQRNSRFLESKLCLFPCQGKYIVTDRAAKNTRINQVMWLWGESFILAGLVERSPRRRAIDLGTGSGVHAILASEHCREVVAVDVNPRAIEFARFNGALNGIDNVEFVLSDLFGSLASTCDFLIANPPYVPDGTAPAGENFWSGGIGGTDILRRIVAAIPTRLAADGVCHLISLYPNPRGTTTREHFDRWLGGRLDEYEVLDHTWPVPNYRDQLSETAYSGDKSAWRFGVISLRRAAHATGCWKDGLLKGSLFRKDGSCCVVADHDGV